MPNLPDISKLAEPIPLPCQELIRETSALIFDGHNRFNWRETPPSSLNAGELRQSVAAALGDVLVVPEGVPVQALGYSRQERFIFTPGEFGPPVSVSAISHSIYAEQRRRLTREQFAALGTVDEEYVVRLEDGVCLVDFPGHDWNGDAGLIFWHPQGEGVPVIGEQISAHTTLKRQALPYVATNLILAGKQAGDGRQFFEVAEVNNVHEEHITAFMAITQQVAENPRP